MTIGDIAESDVVTAARADSVSDVAERMREADVGSVVVEEENLPIGIVTDRQIALALADDPEAGHDHVDEVMTRDVETIDEDLDLYRAAQKLDEEGIRRAPVVDEAGHLDGIVSLDDIIVVIEREMEAASGVIEAQSPRV